MSDHPYRSLPDRNFWKQSIAEVPFDEVDPVADAKFRLGKADRVVTAGSCFAQHIARYLRDAGFNYWVTEPANPMVRAHLAHRFGYGLFSARYGNVYTSRQLVQLVRRAYGLFQPADDLWRRPDGRLIDPFRPRIQPDGFASPAEYRADRRQHFAAIRRAVEELDVFVFTLGLTEGWVARADGAAYPLCPGVAGGSFDETRHVFLNLSVPEVVDDLRQTVSLIRERNRGARFIFTVSPVPLVATAEPRSVLVSTTYSKAVLRVAAEEVARGDDGIDYFPSYEIITGPHARGRYFAEDLRSVTEAGVRHVMGLFFRHYTEAGDEARLQAPGEAAAPAPRHGIEAAVAVMCEEVALEASRPAGR